MHNNNAIHVYILIHFHSFTLNEKVCFKYFSGLNSRTASATFHIPQATTHTTETYSISEMSLLEYYKMLTSDTSSIPTLCGIVTNTIQA